MKWLLKKFPPKKATQILAVVVLALYAVLALAWRGQMEKAKTARKVYDTAKKKYERERKLISERLDWDAKYDEMESLMPIFTEDNKDVDTYWLGLMDRVATENNMSIARRQLGKEVEVGDVVELPIDCRDWEASLNSLVNFLWQLNREGAMLDVQQMFIRPSQRAGYLKGTFILNCAYMRGDEEHIPVPPEADDDAEEEAKAEEDEPSS